MTTEAVLLLAIYAFVMMGVFLGDFGPVATFEKASPRLGAKIEQRISVGRGFRDTVSGGRVPWD